MAGLPGLPRSGAGRLVLRRHLGQLRFKVAPEDDVRAPPGHVRGHGDGAGPTRLSNDFRFPLVELRIEHFVGNAPSGHGLGKALGGFDGGRAHQNRLPPISAILDVFDNGVVLFIHGQEDEIVAIVPDHGLIGGDDHHVEAINFMELVGFRIRCAGHAPELFVKPEKILEGSGGEGLRFLLNRYPFLGLYGLVQALGPAPPGHGPSRVLIDDDHLALLHDVVHIPAVDKARPERCVHVVQEPKVLGGVEAILRRQQPGGFHGFLKLFMALLQQFDLTILLVDREIPFFFRFRGLPRRRLPRLQRTHELVDLAIEGRRIFRRPRDNEGGSGFVDEDRVHLIDNGKEAVALDLILLREGHVIAEVVEAKFVIGAVGDVGEVGRPLFRPILARTHDAHGQAQRLVHRGHPGRIPLREVVVYGHDVNAAPRQRIEVDSQGRHQGFSFPGAHFRNAPLMEGHSAHELYVKVAKPQGSARGFPRCRKGLRKDGVEGLPGIKARLKPRRFRSQGGVVKAL